MEICDGGLRVKRILSAMLLSSLLVVSTACSAVPDEMQADIYLGASKELKLLHINASSDEKEERIRKIYEAVTDAVPTDKPMELFAFYPDYTIEVDDLGADSDDRIEVVLDVNRDRLEFYYAQDGSEEKVIYRSNMGVPEFKT